MHSPTGVASSYGAILRNGSLRRALVGFLIFNAAEYGVWIAITLYAYARGGAAEAGIVMILQLVPAALVAPLAALLGDRIRRDRALAIGYGVQALADGACGVALWFAPPPVAYAAAIVASMTITLTRPVHYAALPQLAQTPEQLTAANSASSAVEGIGVMVGPLGTSALIGTVGSGGVFVLFAAALGVAGVLSIRLQLAEANGRVPEEHAVAGEAFRAFTELRRDPAAAALTVFGGSQFLLIGMLDIFFVVLAVDLLHLGQEGAGWFAAAVGLGGIAGAGATALLVGRRRLAPAMHASVFVMGIGFAAVALVSAFIPAAAMLIAVGAARSFFDVAARTLLQRSVDDDVLARVFGIQEALMMVGLALGAATAPILVALFGTRGAFAAAAVLLPALAVLVYGPLRSLDARALLPDAERLELLRQISIFRILPQHVLERLARELVSLQMSEGERVIREGEAGDSFYVISSGRATVTSGGRGLATLNAGDYFGEIALLRDVPRTATVTASTDMQLLSLDRDEFLSAVTGSSRSERLAHEEIDRRLGATAHEPQDG